MSTLHAINSYPAVDPSAPKPSVTQYVATALQKLEENHVNRDRLNWTKVKQDALAKADGMSSYVETYPLIRKVIADLGEEHSFLVEARPITSTTPAESATAPPPKRKKVPSVLSLKSGAVGYVRIPTFAIPDSVSQDEFARAIRTALSTLGKTETCGWIVDLRQNEGGNMFPALLALGPLMGEGKVGGVRNARVPQFWHYKGEQMFISDKETLPTLSSEYSDARPDDQIVSGVRQIQKFDPPIEIVANAEKPIAILIGKYTASAGEAIAIALQGNKNAKTFGRPTVGKSTGNIGISMADGALLVATVGAFEDKNGIVFRNGINPADTVDSEAPLSLKLDESETTFSRARDWISSKSDCKQRPL